MRGWRLALALFFIFILLMGEPAVASQVRISLDIGFGGYVVPGRWNPLRVTVSGMARPSTIEVRRQSHPGLVEYYPCPATPDGPITLEYPVFADPTGEVFRVRLVSEGQNIAEEKLSTFRKIFPGHIVLAVEVPAPIRQAVSRVLLPQEPLMVVSVNAAELPSMTLDYDGVSGLIIADPAHVFTPAQKRALSPWVSGGGFLLLPKQALEFNLNALNLGKMHTRSEINFHRYGLGKIGIVPEKFADSSWPRETEEWKRVLQLTAYNDSRRLGVGSCFASPVPPIKRPGPPPFLFWIFPVCWSTIAIAIGLAASRKGFIYMMLLTLTASLLAWPVGLVLQKKWQRGAAGINRLVIVPDGGGLYDTRIQLPRAGLWDLSGLKASPWSVYVDAGPEVAGLISAGKGRQEWRHQSGLSTIALAAREDQGLRWVGTLSENEVRHGFASLEPGLDSEPMALWTEGQWAVSVAKNGKIIWKKTASCPHWLLPHRKWCRDLIRLSPNRRWLFGIKDFYGDVLRLQKNPANRFLWAKPLVEEGMP